MLQSFYARSLSQMSYVFLLLIMPCFISGCVSGNSYGVPNSELIKMNEQERAEVIRNYFSNSSLVIGVFKGYYGNCPDIWICNYDMKICRKASPDCENPLNYDLEWAVNFVLHDPLQKEEGVWDPKYRYCYFAQKVEPGRIYVEIRGLNWRQDLRLVRQGHELTFFLRRLKYKSLFFKADPNTIINLGIIDKTAHESKRGSDDHVKQYDAALVIKEFKAFQPFLYDVLLSANYPIVNANFYHKHYALCVAFDDCSLSIIHKRNPLSKHDIEMFNALFHERILSPYFFEYTSNDPFSFHYPDN